MLNIRPALPAVLFLAACSKPDSRPAKKPSVHGGSEPSTAIACAFEDGVTGQPLSTLAVVKVKSHSSPEKADTTSMDGTCHFDLKPGSYDAQVRLPDYDFDYHFPTVAVCSGQTTPLQLAVDLEKSRGLRRSADFDVPCEGF